MKLNDLSGTLVLVSFCLQAIVRYRQGAGGARGARGGPVNGAEGLIGNTPLVRIRSLSELTGCEVRVVRCRDYCCCCVLKGSRHVLTESNICIALSACTLEAYDQVALWMRECGEQLPPCM